MLSWEEECARTFLKHGVIKILQRADLWAWGLHADKCCLPKQFSSCNETFLWEKMKYLHQTIDQEALLFNGTHMRKIPHERYHSYYVYQKAFIVALPGRDIYVLGHIQKRHRQVMRFMKRMCDAKRVDTLLWLKTFLLGEDIDFEKDMQTQ